MSIARYISLRLIGMTIATALVMAIFITYFSNAAIEYDVKNQVRKESRYDYLNIKLQKNGNVRVAKNFVFEENGMTKVVLDAEGNLIAGNYPVNELKDLKVNSRIVREVQCKDAMYYIYDRSIIKNDNYGNAKMIAYVRSMVNENHVTSGYQTLKYASYICAAAIILMSTIVSSIFSRHLVSPIKKICNTAEKIGYDDRDLSKRIEYDGMFKEIEILTEANNRMLDRLEEMFEKQKQFTSDVTHELRTPVSVIMAQCQYAKKHIHDKEEFDEAMNLIERQVKKTNNIISQLLQLSRLDQDRIHIEFEYVDLRDIVEEVCENEKLKDTKNIDLRLSMEKAETEVDVSLMMIAIRNLVNNAIKYSNENAVVDITLKEKENQVEFAVKDYGCGMNEYDRKHIFDRFYRADKARNSEGFGLGMSITAKIVEIHSGKILIESQERKGSTFRILLPRKI